MLIGTHDFKPLFLLIKLLKSCICACTRSNLSYNWQNDWCTIKANNMFGSFVFAEKLKYFQGLFTFIRLCLLKTTLCKNLPEISICENNCTSDIYVILARLSKRWKISFILHPNKQHHVSKDSQALPFLMKFGDLCRGLKQCFVSG